MTRDNIQVNLMFSARYSVRSCRNYERTEWSWLCFSDGVVWTHIITMRLRLFAVKRRKDGSCMSVISFNPSSSFPSFPFAWKGTIEKRERLAWCIGLHLEGSSFLRWTIRSPFKSTLHFYRECERAGLCIWDREQFCFCILDLFPKCSLGSIIVPILFIHRLHILYIERLLPKQERRR